MAKNPKNFWQELKRRKVFRVVAMYAATAFIVLEAVDIVFPRWGLPDWTVNLVILLLIIGFIVAAILAWMFDITPEGIQKTEPVTRATEITEGRRKLQVSDLIIVVLLIVVAILVYPKIFKKDLFTSSNVPSVGVLYLKNLGDEEDEYFSYGITEDIIIDLSKAGLIRVPAMNDILIFKDSDKTLAEIAQNLDVRYVLTGSLKNETGFLRLALQLVEPQKGVNIWSERWKEPFGYVSTVKAKVIDAIIQSLGLDPKSSTLSQIKRNPTTNPDAYELYLKAKYRSPRMQSAEDLEIVRGLYLKATELDSLYIGAYIGLGSTYRVSGETNVALSHFKKALNLASSMDLPLEKANALISIGNVYRTLGQYDEASQSFKEALEIAQEMELKSIECSCLHGLGIISDDHGLWDEAMNFFQQALPIARELMDENLEYSLLNSIGIIHYNKKDIEKALEYFEKSLEIRLELGHHRSAATVIINMAVLEYEKGNNYKVIELNKQALELYEKVGDAEGMSYAFQGMGNAYYALGNFEEAINYLERSIELTRQIGDLNTEGYTLYNIANVHIGRENYLQALDLLNQALRIFNEVQNDRMEGYVYSSIGYIYHEQNDFLNAIDYLNKSVNLFKSLSMKRELLFPISNLILGKIEMGDTLGIADDLKHLELITDSTNIEDVDPKLIWNQYKIYKFLEDDENCKQYLEIAHGKVTEHLNKLRTEKDRQQLIKNTKVYQEIIEEWGKSEY
jgi:tetratricopeptide (TPR) repeat protein